MTTKKDSFGLAILVGLAPAVRHGADPRFGQQRAWTELCARHAVRSSDQGAYAVFGRRLIVHDYARKPL